LGKSGAALAAGSAAVGAAAQGAAKPPLSSVIPLPDAGTKVAPGPAGVPAACCKPAAKLVFACSGSADVGKICDLAARKLSEGGVGKMFCLAGVGGRVKTIMDGTKAAQTMLVLDGCPLQCGRNTMQQAGFKKFEYLCLSDLGMEKGKTAVTDDVVAKVVHRATGLLAG
jgi:uncharacterized metal-binding protein